jgi:nuclear receptor interaction protein
MGDGEDDDDDDDDAASEESDQHDRSDDEEADEDMELDNTLVAAERHSEHEHDEGDEAASSDGDAMRVRQLRDERRLCDEDERVKKRQQVCVKTNQEVCVQKESAVDSRFVQRYTGHSNIHTDIKEAVFLGPNDEFVVSGSDDGNAFIWETSTGILVRVLENADSDIVNCVQVSFFLLFITLFATTPSSTVRVICC